MINVIIIIGCQTIITMAPMPNDSATNNCAVRSCVCGCKPESVRSYKTFSARKPIEIQYLPYGCL